MVQEAVATGDPELVHLVLERRDYQRYSSRVGGVPDLLNKLKEASIYSLNNTIRYLCNVTLVFSVIITIYNI